LKAAQEIERVAFDRLRQRLIYSNLAIFGVLLMKSTYSILTILLAGCLGGAIAAPRADREADYVDTAPVVSATPIYETVRTARPEKECWNEPVEHRSGGDTTGGALAGGIVGGVIGNQFGRGAGKAAMTVVGGVVGATIGQDLSRREPEHRYVADERHCQTVERATNERRIVGYQVKYRYQGQILTTRTAEDPGDRIPLRVAVEPVDAIDQE
jgi:uncharacterized protein YcfJ